MNFSPIKNKKQENKRKESKSYFLYSLVEQPSIEHFHMTSRPAIWCPKTMKTAAMFMLQTSPVGIELFSLVNAFFCSNKFV